MADRVEVESRAKDETIETQGDADPVARFLKWGIQRELKLPADERPKLSRAQIQEAVSTAAIPPDFDSDYYLLRNPDVALANIDPIEHFLLWGMREGRVYRRTGDVRVTEQPPTQDTFIPEAVPLSMMNAHDLTDWGFQSTPPFPEAPSLEAGEESDAQDAQVEGLPPDFEPFLYLRANPDVAAAKVDPIWHYVNLGRFEGRAYKTGSDPVPDDIDPEFVFDTRPSREVRPAPLMKDGMPSWPPILFRVGACDINKMKRNRALASYLYLRGSGIEVKAMNAPLPIRKNSTVRYIEDIETERVLKNAHIFSEIYHVKPHIIDDADALSRLGDASEDFVILNNSLHFSENAIKSLRNAMRVIRPGGVVYASVIDKRFSVDVRRKVTPLQHFWQDFTDGVEAGRSDHYWDFWNNVLVPLAGAKPLSERGVYAERLIFERRPIHFHVWTHGSFIGFIQSVLDGLNLGCELELSIRNEVETICIIRKESS